MALALSPSRYIPPLMYNTDVFTVAQTQIVQQFWSNDITYSQRLEPRLWVLVDNYFPQSNLDFQFWWRSTGVSFAVLLEKAGYLVDAQCQYLLFYHICVVPELGAGGDAQGLPRHWESFMTDHFSPIELSWEWGIGGESPIVRFSIEPIGPSAGTAADPLNQYATARLVRQYQRLLRDCDLKLFDHFSKELLSYSHCADEIHRSSESQGHRSRTFIAVDFGDESTMLKAYFLPSFKAAELGLSTWTVISQAIQDLTEYSPSALPGLSTLQNFLLSSPQGLGLKAEMFAIDCVVPAMSRLKIYMRSQSTSFNSVRGIMTLGGVLNHPDLDHGLEELHEIWKLVLSQGQEFSAAEDLREKDHRTAGMLYYFDIKHGKACPGVKVYLPVRHYGQTDLTVAEGLRTYLKRRGQGSLACRYLEALTSVSSSSSLQSRCGVQTYLGCSIVRGELKLTSYVAPEVYKMHFRP